MQFLAQESGWLPPALVDWPPVVQALTLGLATFVQEDVPTLTAAVLAAAGALSTAAGFWGCFLGIWVGDVLLFGLARGVGRPVLQINWVKKRLGPNGISRQEEWFSRRGTWLLVSARMIPGTRLPTYLAAGLLRWPIGRFLVVTGAAALVWTISWFALARLVGARLPGIWSRWQQQAWIPLFLAATVWLVVFIVSRSFRKATPLPARWEKWRQWEFWPAWLFYIPIIFQYIRLSIRHLSFTLPSVSNPGIAFGGLVGESKLATLRELTLTSPDFTAAAEYIPAGPIDARMAEFQHWMNLHHWAYPVILKPDLGQRGMGVRVIPSEEAALHYLNHNSAPLVVQRYVPGPYEVGIFYYRFPDQDQGHIFSITEKIFPVITGDGRHTLRELILTDVRARFVAKRYLARFSHRLQEILPSGQTLRLVEAGNHAQGCIFRDGAELATPALTARIDAISKGLPGFFIGRYDIRYSNPTDLAAGLHFQILELNGASAEATSAYDARHSVVQAYRILFRQWHLVFSIAAANRRRGARPCHPRDLLKAWREARQLFKLYPIAD